MKKILITFIGNNDCRLGEGKGGPILDILSQRDFDVLHLLHNQDSYLQYCSEILVYCQKKHPHLTVRYQDAKASNPSDYNLVYPAMVAAVKAVLEEEGEKDAEYTISVTSGTPVMHACWLFMVQGGIIKARLVQSSLQEGVKDIDLSLDDFPQITSPSLAKVKLTQTTRENKLLRQQALEGLSEMIGEDKGVIDAKKQIVRLAEYDVPVFLSGESGTGKEVAAKLLHYKSSRAQGPLVAVNCGAISPNLFESEFFGHKKGAFTGSVVDHEGFFSQADKGTLFLDEIGDLPLEMQVKLLRVIETGTFRPVGGREKKADARLVTASNKDLGAMIAAGSFREDLFYRVVQTEIALPPLRQRGTDIVLLARYFLEEFSARNGRSKLFSPAAEKKLLGHSYPGNVRELQSIVRKAYINCLGNEIEPGDMALPDMYRSELRVEIPDVGTDLMNKVIPAYILAALGKTRGNAAAAARLLGMEPHAFRARLRKMKESVN